MGLSPVPPALPCWPVPCPGLPVSPLDSLGLPGYFPACAKCTAISGGVLLVITSSPSLLRVESMSLADRGNPGNITSRLVEKKKAQDCLIPMG